MKVNEIISNQPKDLKLKSKISRRFRKNKEERTQKVFRLMQKTNIEMSKEKRNFQGLMTL
jgi:hypothetical protein